MPVAMRMYRTQVGLSSARLAPVKGQKVLRRMFLVSLLGVAMVA